MSEKRNHWKPEQESDWLDRRSRVHLPELGPGDSDDYLIGDEDGIQAAVEGAMDEVNDETLDIYARMPRERLQAVLDTLPEKDHAFFIGRWRDAQQRGEAIDDA